MPPWTNAKAGQSDAAHAPERKIPFVLFRTNGFTVTPGADTYGLRMVDGPARHPHARENHGRGNDASPHARHPHAGAEHQGCTKGCVIGSRRGTLFFLLVYPLVSFKFNKPEPSIHAGFKRLFDSPWTDRIDNSA